VIVLAKTNLVEEHIQDIEIHHTFNRVLMLQEPLLLIAFIFLLCLVVIVTSKLDFSLSTDARRDVSARISTIVSNILKHHEVREGIYETHDSACTRFKSNKDNNLFQTTLKKINGEYKQETQNITDLIPKLKAEGASSDLIDRINDLQRLDRSLKEQLQQEVTLTERLVSQKISKQAYLEQEKKFVNTKLDIVKKLHFITAFLNDVAEAN